MHLRRLIEIAGSFSAPGRSIAQLRCVQDNLGDILVADAINEMLLPLRAVSAADTRLFRLVDKVVGLRRLFKYGCLGGGTLIFAPHGIGWLESVQYYGSRVMPLCTFGTGVIDPEFRHHITTINGSGFIIDKATIDGWIECLNEFRFVSVRGCESERILREHGYANAEVIGDPALFYAKDTVKSKEFSKRIGFNVSSCLEFWSNSQEKVGDALTRVMKCFQKRGWSISVFATEAHDVEFAKQICDGALSDTRIVDCYSSPLEFIDLLAEQDVFVGTKLHSVIGAFCVYTPAIMIGYQPKCYDFMKTMGFEKYFIRSDQVTADAVIDLVDATLADLPGLQQEQWKVVQSYRERMLNFRTRVLASIGMSPI